MSEQQCRICGQNHLTGACANGEVGISSTLVSRILKLDGGENLLKYLQDAHAKGYQIPEVFSEKILSSLSDEELSLFTKQAGSQNDSNLFDEEVKKIMPVETNHMSAKVETQESVSVEKFLALLEMFERYVADSAKVNSDGHADVVRNKIKEVQEKDGIDLFEQIPNLQARLDKLDHDGAWHAIQAHLTYCNLWEKAGDMNALAGWWNSLKEILDINKSRITPDEYNEAEVSVKKIGEILKPYFQKIKDRTGGALN